MLLAKETVDCFGGVHGGFGGLPPPPEPLPAQPLSTQQTSRAPAAPGLRMPTPSPRICSPPPLARPRGEIKEQSANCGSVTGLERGLERRQVLQLVGKAAQAVEHAVDLALCPFELLRTHLGEGAAQLVVQRHESVHARDTGLTDAAVDLAGEIDELIGLANHLFHRILRCDAQKQRVST